VDKRFIVQTLLLWDIDGTLIDSGGGGERSLRFALEKEFGISDPLGWLELAGRTDRWIAEQVLVHHHLPVSEENVQRFLRAYLATVAEQLMNPRARVLPGVREMLERIASHPTATQGLLTGNLESGAKIKLGHFDLWKYFAFGAYADDSALRNELGPHAVRRASAHHAVSFRAERIFVIGDTPHDIACGKVIGAKTIAVATGRYSESALAPFAADFVFPNLLDLDRVVKVLGLDD
jgi:phosphoglycolate phosphatase